MKRAIFIVLILALSVNAHVGDRIYPIPEIPDETLNELDLHDRGLEDWEAVGLYPVLTAMDFFSVPEVGGVEGASYNPNDLDYQIWLGWNGSTSRLYFAMERIDNIFVNEYEGGPPDNWNGFWKHDGSFEFAVDGDHSGGSVASSEGTEEERTLNRSRTAQLFFGIMDAPYGQHIGYWGRGSEWAIVPPYADGSGGTIGEAPAVSLIECFVTPFDDLIWNDPEASKPSKLFSGKTIGFFIGIPDFDTEPGQYRAYHTLGTLPLQADFFVDGLLIGVQGETSVEDIAWARIKASFRSD